MSAVHRWCAEGLRLLRRARQLAIKGGPDAPLWRRRAHERVLREARWAFTGAARILSIDRGRG